jgi:hypothetical protein
MSKAAPAFSGRRSFVNRNRLGLDSAALFASADLTAQPFSRADSAIQTNLSAETIAWLHL